MPALPKMVLDRYENQPKYCFFNMLPEIGRCWATIDNCLFLWRLGEKCARLPCPEPRAPLPSLALPRRLLARPYPTARLCRDPIPTVYSLEEEVITCVGLAPAKPGVFMTAVKYVLVLCTRVEVVLLGVCFSADDPGRQVLPLPQRPSLGCLVRDCSPAQRAFLC